MNRLNFSHYRKITLHAILLISFCLGIAFGCGSKLAKENHKIQDPNPSVRYLATGALADINDTQVVELLITALQDNDKNVVSRAIEGLAQIGDKRAISPLIAALRTEDPLVRHKATEALIKFDQPTVEPLIAALNDNDSNFVQRAAAVLGKIGDRQATEPLMGLLEHTSNKVRIAAAAAVGSIGDPKAVLPRIAVLKDESQVVQYQAPQAPSIYHPYAIEELIAVPLIDSLEHEADTAFGLLRDQQVIPLLINVFKDENQIVQYEAAKTLFIYRPHSI